MSTAPTKPQHPSGTSSERVAGGVVDSVQSATLPRPAFTVDSDGALLLVAAYWTSLRRATRGAVRPRTRPHGMDIVLFGIVPLLRLSRPELEATDDRVAASFSITGGLLAAGAGGQLVLEQRGGPVTEVSITVREYRARLARGRQRLYRAVQGPAHRAVSRRFLRDLTGTDL